MAMVDGWNWAEKPSEEDLFCDVKKYIKFWAFLRGWTWLEQIEKWSQRGRGLTQIYLENEYRKTVCVGVCVCVCVCVCVWFI